MNLHDKVGNREAFAHIPISPFFQRLSHRGLFEAHAGENQHRQMRVPFFQNLQKAQAIGLRHDDVQHHKIERELIHKAQRLFDTSGCGYTAADPLQLQLRQASDCGLIINKEEMIFRSCKRMSGMTQGFLNYFRRLVTLPAWAFFYHRVRLTWRRARVQSLNLTLRVESAKPFLRSGRHCNNGFMTNMTADLRRCEEIEGILRKACFHAMDAEAGGCFTPADGNAHFKGFPLPSDDVAGS